jgi:DNA (cytosine-5)-methyltransferase 1
MGNKYKKTFAEFFAGMGLMRMGLESQGWKVLFANDIDPQKEEMYKAAFPKADNHFKPGDIHGFSPHQIPTVTLATASFPCNDLSLAGSREGLGGKNSSAFWGFVRLLGRMGHRSPPLLLIENVPGFLTSNEGRDFEDAMLSLNDLGYVVDPFIIDAAWFVPQSRQRLFVVATKRHEPTMDGISLIEGSILRPSALTQFIMTHPDIQWCIRRLPIPPKRKENLEAIVEKLPKSFEGWWSTERAQYLLEQMSSRHRKVAQTMIDGRKWSYGTVFRRVRNGKSMAELRTDGVAGCLRTPRGGSGRQILFQAGRGQYRVRLLTPRECGRLMGVPNFTLNVPLNQALFGFGDAVCVPVIRWIANNYLNALWKEEYESRTSSQEVTNILPYRRAARA